jgi:hypothetical protein
MMKTTLALCLCAVPAAAVAFQPAPAAASMPQRSSRSSSSSSRSRTTRLMMAAPSDDTVSRGGFLSTFCLCASVCVYIIDAKHGRTSPLPIPVIHQPGTPFHSPNTCAHTESAALALGGGLLATTTTTTTTTTTSQRAALAMPASEAPDLRPILLTYEGKPRRFGDIIGKKVGEAQGRGCCVSIDRSIE